MFENIIGHKEQKQIFEKAISTEIISHAYLFTGKRGIGKCSFAKEFAKILLGTNNLEVCLDYKYICKDETKKDLSVEIIRKELIEDLHIAPAMSSRKVYIIDDGETLNTTSQNALLKTLEEPPKNVHIIIVSDTESTFLPTILSRVNLVKFTGISKQELKLYISKTKGIELNDNILDFLDGSIGEAYNIINEDKIEQLKKIDELYSSIIKKDVIQSLRMAENSLLSDKKMLEYLEYLFQKYKMYLAVKFVEKANLRLKNNGNYDIVIDNMIINIINNI